LTLASIEVVLFRTNAVVKVVIVAAHWSMETENTAETVVIQGGAETIRRFKFSAMPTYL
jgi:metal-responsive CopG/Arc/MetJ family transcriptional regulator